MLTLDLSDLTIRAGAVWLFLSEPYKIRLTLSVWEGTLKPDGVLTILSFSKRSFPRSALVRFFMSCIYLVIS